MKILKGDLKRVLRGQMTLDEARVRVRLTEEVPTAQVADPNMLENDSLDSQIDRFLMQGEQDMPEDSADQTSSAPESPVAPRPAPAPAQESYTRLNLASLLEAPGDDTGIGGEPDPAAPPLGDAPDPNAPAPDQGAEPAGNGKTLDTVAFCDNLARLVEKHESLLDIKGTIVRRALNWVTKNYDAKQSKEVRQVLEGNFGITPDNVNDPYEDDMAPNASGAGVGLNA